VPRKRGRKLVLGYIPKGRTIWIVDAHRGDGKRFVVHADEKLTAFVEVESGICRCRGPNAVVLAMAAVLE
jgi:hypothetical protein